MPSFALTKSSHFLQDALQAGQSADLPSVSQAFQLAAASWLVSVASTVVANELNDLGLVGFNDARGSLGLGRTQPKNWLRAEWSGGFNLR